MLADREPGISIVVTAGVKAKLQIIKQLVLPIRELSNESSLNWLCINSSAKRI